MLPITIFFCYAREDEVLLNKLKTHLQPLQRQKLIDVWHDRDICAGSEWELEIKKHLNAAQIILLLISPDFMASDYCYGVEMEQAMTRHEQGSARVIPIILRPIYWQGAPFGKLQALPTDAKPVINSIWHSLDDAFFDVAEGVRKQIISLHIQQARKQQLRDEDHSVFLCNATLTDPSEFFGREREILTLLNRTRVGQSTSIIGFRRIGKTWLLSYLCLIAEEKWGDKLTIGYLDATSPKCSGMVGFTTEILHALDIPLPDEPDLKTNLIALEDAAAQKRANGEFFILCIDEFEGVCKQRDFSLEVLENLRAVAQQYQLGLVTASKEPLLHVVARITGSETSPFFNIFLQLRLRPFSRPDAEKFVKEKGQQAQFTEQENLLLLECSQDKERGRWHPWLLQFVGELIHQDKRLTADSYRPDDPAYREELLQRIEDGSKGVIET